MILINSIQVIILDLIFLIEINYTSYVVNTGFTFLFYPIFFIVFNFLTELILQKKNVEVLNTVDIVKEDDTHDKVIVAVKQNNLLATAFHPELTDDSRWHQYFVEDIVKKKS